MKLQYQQTVSKAPARRIYLLCVFRDEQLLLEYFMSYYTTLGITHFIMLDNGSIDGGPEYLRSIRDINISLYHSEQSYRDADYGTAWLNALLQAHCRDQYCLVVDADELFAFDTRKHRTIGELIEAMEASNANAVATNLVDMYPPAIGETYVSGSDFRDHSPYFDTWNAEHYARHHSIYGTFAHKVGGMRKRVFGAHVCIHNFPFFRYDFHPIGLAPGRHYFQRDGKTLRSSNEIRLLADPGVLLHFKFLKPDFRAFVMNRIRNNEDWNDSAEYRAYLHSLERCPNLRLVDPAYSRRLKRIEDLDGLLCAWPTEDDASA